MVTCLFYRIEEPLFLNRHDFLCQNLMGYSAEAVTGYLSNGKRVETFSSIRGQCASMKLSGL